MIDHSLVLLVEPMTTTMIPNPILKIQIFSKEMMDLMMIHHYPTFRRQVWYGLLDNDLPCCFPVVVRSLFLDFLCRLLCSKSRFFVYPLFTRNLKRMREQVSITPLWLNCNRPQQVRWSLFASIVMSWWSFSSFFFIAPRQAPPAGKRTDHLHVGSRTDEPV